MSSTVTSSSAGVPERGEASAVLSTFVEILPEAEYILASDPAWLRALVSAYNAAFHFGHTFMLLLLTCALMVMAPFIGMAAACWSYLASIARTAAVTVGRCLSDELGYGHYVRTRAAYIAWKRRKAQANNSAQSTLPLAGVRPSSRYPALNESEIFSFTDGLGIRQPVRIFNLLFSYGFAAGTVICVMLTVLFSPFIGMFVSGLSVAMSLWRTFSRAEGRLFTDVFGVSDLVDQSTAFMMEEMGITADHARLGGVPHLASMPAAVSFGQPPSNFSQTAQAPAIPYANPYQYASPLAQPIMQSPAAYAVPPTMVHSSAYGATAYPGPSRPTAYSSDNPEAPTK